MFVSDFYNKISKLIYAEILTKKGYKIAVHHIETIKPFRIDSEMKRSLEVMNRVILDDDYCDGVAKAIAFDLLRRLVLLWKYLD